MAGASLIASAASGAMNTVGSYYASKGQKTSLKMQARIDEINAKIADASARDALLRGERAEQQQRLSAAQLRSRQRVALAGNNVDLGSETAAAILTGTDYLTEMDATQIKANALRESFGLRTEAGNLRSSARMNRATAKAISPGMQAFSTLLTSASKVGSDYYAFSESGALQSSKDRWSKIYGKAKGMFG